jgi:hypothetical protein
MKIIMSSRLRDIVVLKSKDRLMHAIRDDWTDFLREYPPLELDVDFGSRLLKELPIQNESLP